MPPAVPGRQPGETAYQYRARRTQALYGQTPYARRVASARAKGQTLTQARRGRAVATPAQEYEQRAAATAAAHGATPYQMAVARADAWLTANGYTPATTGMSASALRRVEPRLRYINENSPTGQLTPALIHAAATMEADGELEPGWITDRIAKRYQSMIDFMNGDKARGNFYWFFDGGDGEEYPWAAWWYYH
jgi:hypothetical protein